MDTVAHRAGVKPPEEPAYEGKTAYEGYSLDHSGIVPIVPLSSMGLVRCWLRPPGRPAPRRSWLAYLSTFGGRAWLA